MTSRSPVMHTKDNQEMDFKSVRFVGHEANFHELLFLEAWMPIKDPQSGNGHISLYVFLKLHEEFPQRAFDVPLSFLLTLTNVNISTDEGCSSSRNVLNETSKRVRRALTHFIIHQTHYEKSDWLRAFNQFAIACDNAPWSVLLRNKMAECLALTSCRRHS